MKFLRSFGQFWYDFIIGDDWKIAIAVVVALGLTTLVLATTPLPDTTVAVFGGCAVLAAFTVSLAVDSRRGHRWSGSSRQRVVTARRPTRRASWTPPVSTFGPPTGCSARR